MYVNGEYREVCGVCRQSLLLEIPEADRRAVLAMLDDLNGLHPTATKTVWCLVTTPGNDKELDQRISRSVDLLINHRET